MEHEINS